MNTDPHQRQSLAAGSGRLSATLGVTILRWVIKGGSYAEQLSAQAKFPPSRLVVGVGRAPSD
jgi:hypothetical protein